MSHQTSCVPKPVHHSAAARASARQLDGMCRPGHLQVPAGDDGALAVCLVARRTRWLQPGARYPYQYVAMNRIPGQRLLIWRAAARTGRACHQACPLGKRRSGSARLPRRSRGPARIRAVSPVPCSFWFRARPFGSRREPAARDARGAMARVTPCCSCCRASGVPLHAADSRHVKDVEAQRARLASVDARCAELRAALEAALARQARTTATAPLVPPTKSERTLASYAGGGGLGFVHWLARGL